MKQLSYQDYIAEIDIDEETGLLSGIVVNTITTLHFTGRTVEELRSAFAETVRDYLAWCEARGEPPETPFSGQLLVDVTPEVQRRVVEAASKAGQPVSDFVRDALSRVA